MNYMLFFEPAMAVPAILINFIFIVLVLTRTSRSIFFMIFLFTCAAVMFWNFFDFMSRLTEDRRWFFISLVCSALIPALMFHFVMTLATPVVRSVLRIAPAYLLSFVLASAAFGALFSPKIGALVDGPLWDLAYFTMVFPLFLTGLFMLVRAFRKADSDEEKNRLLFIVLAGFIGVFTAFTDHVQHFHVPFTPLGHAGSFLYSSVLAVGVFRHRTAYDILAQTRMKLDMMSEIAAGIAHEIRNPLSSIKGASKLLGDEMKDFTGRHKCGEYIDIIREEVERLNNVVADFQYFTKPLKAKMEETSVNDVIRKTVRLTDLGASAIKFCLNLEDGLPDVRVDASLIKQVFLNLIRNAAEACGRDGEITINTEYVPPWVKINFCDNGPGVPRENISRVFEPFFTTKTDGMGVGLAISRRIIEAHNGRIEASNISPKGARFSILLPEGKG